MEAKEVVLKPPRRGEAPRGRHPWVYRSQIADVKGAPQPGDVVGVRTVGGRFTGTGYFNEKSEITVRLLSPEKLSPDLGFFKTRLAKAAALRQRFVKDTNAFRLVSSEADGLPGLIVDQYGEILVVQFLTLGMERLREKVLEALRETVPAKGIYERSDSSSRRIEGLGEKVGWIERSCGDEIEIFERGVRYKLRFGEGHKTGFYLDQRENRFLLADLGVREALDVFCYEGGFALHLASRGARVLGIDIQKEVTARAEENRALNGISKDLLEFRTANAFDELKALEKEKRRFDIVILDPPSFVKKKAQLEGAVSGYKEILLRGMKLLNPDGLLAVFSCSYHVDENLLMQTSLSAAWDTHKELKLIRFLKQSADHPIDPFIPETYYLKGFLFQIS